MTFPITKIVINYINFNIHRCVMDYFVGRTKVMFFTAA